MLIDFKDYIIGGLTVLIARAMLKDATQEKEDFEEDQDHETLLQYEYDHGSNRTVELYCQGCRKVKKHREVEPDLYQCTKCKRLVDLR